MENVNQVHIAGLYDVQGQVALELAEGRPQAHKRSLILAKILVLDVLHVAIGQDGSVIGLYKA